jgi:hypothetical protein
METATTNEIKGDSLETIASYLFLLIPGWIPRRNLRNEAFETDIVVRNYSPTADLMADIFGRDFIVECKNWKDPIGVKDLGYFLLRMSLTHAKFGVLFSRQGITGNDTTDAKSLLKRAFHESNSICVVVTLEDLRDLEKGGATFRSLLFKRMEEIRFGS